MISFANAVPANSPSQNSSTALTEMLNSTVNNSVALARLNKNPSNDAFRIKSIYVRYMATSCTVSITASVGYDATHFTVTETATAETCDQAWEMALNKLSSRLHQLKSAL